MILGDKIVCEEYVEEMREIRFFVRNLLKCSEI